jgi:hypothetical protein
VPDWIRKALTRKVVHARVRGKREAEVVEPDERLVLLVKFGIGMTLCLSGMEIAHLIILRTWSSEIFSTISLLTGTILGIFVGHKVS